ncbi:NAD(P)H-dependent oxidoreductase [Actinomyces polynesiensis]|uniref:NAD(P)H-dependent oxidoreductase n=1 Tax=Actinomyces polynesiensis TaxID=1325934 RepID=UPI0006949F23|nr:NAD(P)H-dependent oxidoreductase [Actinomyces polynesiensis]
MSAVGSTPEEPLRIVVVNAGLSSESATARLGHALVRSLRDHATRRALSVEVTVVDLRPLARAVADALTTGFAPPDLQTALDSVGAADGVIALTPVYRASFSGLFKSFFDVVDEDACGATPVLLGATGGTPATPSSRRPR